MRIAWPSFLLAAVLELVVFAFVDPQDMHWLHGSLEISRQAAYTAAFFLFWSVTAIAGAFTTLLSMSPFEVNRCHMPDCERPDTCKIQKS